MIHNKLPPSRKEVLLLLVLAGIQFTHILDFMIIMPLGPQLTHAFGISYSQFGFLVSAYTFAAGASGLLACVYIDRFERRRLLLILYGLFAVATIGCALAHTYETLMFARIASGVFGGVLSAMIQTIVGDVIPFERRGRAMGVVMSAFSVSSVMGVPLGLDMAAHMDWHAPFIGIGLLSSLVLVIGIFTLPVMNQHLQRVNSMGMFHGISQVLKDKNHQRGFLFSFCLVFAGFSIIPYITLYMQNNAGIAPAKIPLIYLFGGAATLISAQVLGRISDSWGKVQTLQLVALLACIPMFLVTLVADLPLVLILCVTTIFFVLVSGRMIPGMAILTSAANPAFRGAFMTLNSSIQSAAMGLSALCGGFLISRDANGLIQGYWMCSVLAIVFNLCAVWLATHMKMFK